MPSSLPAHLKIAYKQLLAPNFCGHPPLQVSSDESVLMVEPRHLDQLLHPMFARKEERAYRESGLVLATGLAASPGAGVGRLVFTAEDAEAWQAKGEKVRSKLSMQDVHFGQRG